jgi:hypothetical protein
VSAFFTFGVNVSPLPYVAPDLDDPDDPDDPDDSDDPDDPDNPDDPVDLDVAIIGKFMEYLFILVKR